MKCVHTWLLGVACAALLLAGCGGKKNDDSEAKAATFTHSDGTTVTCSGDQILYQDGYCRSPQGSTSNTGSWRCPSGTVLYSDGLCRAPNNQNGADARGKYCPPGTILYSDGLCRVPQASGGITCPYGTVLYSDGVCR